MDGRTVCADSWEYLLKIAAIYGHHSTASSTTSRGTHVRNMGSNSRVKSVLLCGGKKKIS